MREQEKKRSTREERSDFHEDDADGDDAKRTEWHRAAVRARNQDAEEVQGGFFYI